MKLALKKTPRAHCLSVIPHTIGCRLDNTIYSHCETVFSDGWSASSVIGEGVRFKKIIYTPQAWDFYTLPSRLEDKAYKWYEDHEGEPYDYLGMLRFGLTLLPQSPLGWHCTESLGTALGWSAAWRYGPGGALARCQDQYGSTLIAPDPAQMTLGLSL